MQEYQLEIKQIVDYPRCRIYRQFVQSLLADRSICTSGGSGLFYFTVLSNYANFRVSYRRLDGVTYTICPGEWVCRIKELQEWFRVRFQHQVLAILDRLHGLGLITYDRICRGLIKYRISDWRRHNTVLDYNCPCQKETGFFFLPVETARRLIASGPASEMDVVLDLWISAVYQDDRVAGSDLGPVAYFRNGTGSPLVSYSELSERWGHSRSTVGRILKKLADAGYLELMSFPGRSGSVIYLKDYLSTMFQISDVLIDKEEVALRLNIVLRQPKDEHDAPAEDVKCRLIVPNGFSSVSKPDIKIILAKVSELLAAQGLPCLNCPQSAVKLYPLSGDCGSIVEGADSRGAPIRIGLTVFCHQIVPLYRFELSVIPIPVEHTKGGIACDKETHRAECDG